jgi:hypothetical protein
MSVSHRRWFDGKVSSVVSPSSVGLGGDAFGASSMATRSRHVVGPSDAFDVVVLVIGSVFTMHSFLLLVLALRLLVLLASGAARRPLSLVVPRRLRVGLRLSATRLDHPLDVARSSMSMAVWNPSFSLRLPCCAWSSFG